MKTLESLSERAFELVDKVGTGLKQVVPGGAEKWLKAGATLGALKTGGRVASRLVRRNPTIVIASAASAGLLWYVAWRKARQAEQAPIEGKATRVEARRGDPASTRRKPAAARKRSRTTTPGNGSV